MIGTKLAQYEITRHLGSGGMGDVYQAVDLKLGRSVAIKFLPEAFAYDSERVSRFKREARVLASLNHPNIAAIHGLEEFGSRNFLVMELVSGETLADRIAKGAVPIDKALGIAAKIAEALEAAHEKGITHRDLKPANIKLTDDGTVKVLDFGLAKVTDSVAASAAASDSPTFTIGATQAGMILGTAAYMSPEQARGKSVDKRADIWAFGVVLYELLTGRQLFTGEDTSEILAKVIRDEPALDAIPARVRPLLRRCLEKDPQRRLRDIGDAMSIIENTSESPASATRHWALWAAAAALLILLGALSVIHFREQPTPEPAPIRFQIRAPNDKAPQGEFVAISPDGRKLAFFYEDRLWVHFLETGESRDLNVKTTGYPFWSPDSRFLGFPTDGKLKKIQATGGAAQTICDLAVDWGSGSWNQDDVIIFGLTPGPIFKVPAAGGVPVPVTKLDPSRQERTHVEPWFLPDGRHFLYVRRGAEPGYSYYIGSLDAKPEEQTTKPFLTAYGQPVYAPSADPRTGYLLFTREDTLMAQPFDNSKQELTGQPVALAEQVGGSGGGWATFSVSANGVLVFQRAGSVFSQLTWFDRQGKTLGIVGDPAPYVGVSLSPDGTQAATLRNGVNQGIWLLELARGTSIRFTSDPFQKSNPVWSPDGSRIAFRQRGSGLVVKPSNGAGAQELLFKSPLDLYPSSWSPDGHFLLYSVTDAKTRSDVWVLPIDGDRNPVLVLNTEFNEFDAQFSPDGRWIAYSSDESGKYEVYVRPFESPSGKGAAAGAKQVVSTGGGSLLPRGWRNDGKELYYVHDGKVMAVEISTSPVFRVGMPQTLFQFSNLQATAGDGTADGKRSLLAVPVRKTSSEPYSVVLNWPALLKR